MTLFTWRCVRCLESVELQADQTGIDRWRSGELIQHALPDLAPAHREALKMNWCLTCVDEVYREMEEQ